MAKGATGLCALAVLAGCKVGPNYKRPVVATPDSYRGATAPEIVPSPSTGTAAAAPLPLGAEKYTSVFTDPVLQGLIAEALKNNYDVKIAADRVLEQQAQVGVTRAAQFPIFNLGATEAGIGLPSGALSSAGSNVANNYHGGGFSGSLSFNPDFWGLYRRQTEAARANLRATQWAQQATYSTLVENVATSYYQLRTLDAELRITQDTLAARKQSLDLTRKLEQGGADSLADVRQAEELYYTAQAQIPDIERQIEQQENSLSILLGRQPGPIARGAETADAPHPAEVPAGLPSALLERRPDIRRQEELLVQANANIGVARAQFFPQFSITGQAGQGTTQLKGLIESKSVYYLALGSISQPIFDGGKIRGNYRLAKADYQEMLDTYQQTIAGALRDVSNALIAYNKTREYRERQEKQTASAQDAVRLARIRYQAGSTSYLELLTTDTALYNSQLTLDAAEQQEALALVQLYNALGGGW